MTLTEYFGKKSNLLNAHYGIYLEHLLTELSTFPPDFSMKLPKAEDETLKYYFSVYAVDDAIDISKYYVRSELQAKLSHNRRVVNNVIDISEYKDFFMNPYVRSKLRAKLSYNRGVYVDLVMGRIIPVRNGAERYTALAKMSDAFLI